MLFDVFCLCMVAAMTVFKMVAYSTKTKPRNVNITKTSTPNELFFELFFGMFQVYLLHKRSTKCQLPKLIRDCIVIYIRFSSGLVCFDPLFNKPPFSPRKQVQNAQTYTSMDVSNVVQAGNGDLCMSLESTIL